jgi:RNA polymerase sigma factor (sigma-70 family)
VVSGADLFIFHILMSDIQRISRSTADAFAAFYEQYMPKVFRYVSYRVADTHLAEDLTSTVFEKALAKFDRYSPAKAALSTWIFSIARNALIDHFRMRSRERTVPLEAALEAPGKDKSPEQSAIDQEECRTLRLCIAQLPAHEQEIISLKFSSEMTNRQIAGMLGLSELNVGVILYRTIRKLRSAFEGQNG